MRAGLLILLVALAGCAAAPSMSADTDTRASWQGPAQRSGGGRTTTVGLPLTRAQKIGLWTGVAVLLAYLMADDDDADDSAAVD